MNRPRRLMIVAGEPSGDLHAAHLLAALRRQDPSLEAFGIGGDALVREGCDVLVHVRDMAVMGFSEVIRRLFFFRRVFRRMLAVAESRKPDAILLVDYPGFNLRFAAAAHRRGMKVLYFICPQVWAWNRSRIPAMARSVNRLLSIFPFEPEVFGGTSLQVDYVGHPLVEASAHIRNSPPEVLPWPGPVRVAMLPGSREHEVRRLLPVYLETARALARTRPEVGFLFAAPDERIAAMLRPQAESPRGLPSRVVVGQTPQALIQAHAAIVASGTATLESALLRCPTVLVYRVSALTYALGRFLVRVPHIGIVNILAGSRVMPEFLQDAAKPDAIAAAVQPLLGDTPARRQMLAAFAHVAEQLGTGGAIERAAGIVARELVLGDPPPTPPSTDR